MSVGPRGELVIDGTGGCLCPMPCKAQAEPGLYVRNKHGHLVAVCRPCFEEDALTFEQILTTEGGTDELAG